MIRDVEVDTGEVVYCETSGADQVQGVATAVSGEVDVLCEDEALQ